MIGTLDRLEPITLDDLNDRAALLTRVDRKYLLNRADAERLIDGMAHRSRVLDIGDARAFGYRSLYFDTPQLTSYLDAAHGRRRRFKVRIRSYLDSGDRFVEVKTRGQRGTTVKDRVPAWCHDRLDRDDRGHVREALVAGGIVADVTSLEPVLTTEYERSTIVDLASGCRTTIDTGLRWHLPDGRGMAPDDLVVVETKSPGRASGVDRLLWSMHHRPQSVSKYATGLAVMRPELPSHRWKPVIRRHFTSLHPSHTPAHAHQPSYTQQENHS